MIHVIILVRNKYGNAHKTVSFKYSSIQRLNLLVQSSPHEINLLVLMFIICLPAQHVHNTSGPTPPPLSPLEQLRHDLSPPVEWQPQSTKVKSGGLLHLPERIGSLERCTDLYSGVCAFPATNSQSSWRCFDMYIWYHLSSMYSPDIHKTEVGVLIFGI